MRSPSGTAEARRPTAPIWRNASFCWPSPTDSRGAPAVSRSVDVAVRAGLVERTQDPDNRRRLALRLSEAGRARLDSQPSGNRGMAGQLARLAHSELRAIERALEILERLPA